MSVFDWHSLSYEEKLKERAKVAIYAPNDIEYQSALKGLCKTDPIFLIEMFLFTKDPKKNPACLPFFLYPYEKNLINWLEDKLKDKDDALVEKSRQMGVSWTTLAWLYAHWLVDSDFVALVGSRKEELVDKRGKDDTLFYKFDYFIDRTPRWLLPRKFNKMKDRRHMLLVNRENGSTIFGESSNPNFGRGGSLTCALCDEFSSWPDASASWDSLSQATAVKIIVSTPKAATFFKSLRFSTLKDRVKTIHWSQHPERDEEWYKEQKEKLSPETLAQEIDISYDVTGRGRVYEEFDIVPIGDYKYDPKLPLYVAWDYGLDDETAIIWAQKDIEKNKIYIIDSYHCSDKVIDFYVPFIIGYIPIGSKEKPFPFKESDYSREELAKIGSHSKWKKARHFGDPAGKQRNQVTNSSVIQILNTYGIYVFTNDKANNFIPRRDATKILLRYLYVDKKNYYFIDSIQQSRYPERKVTSQSTSPIARPIHDQFSHFRTCLEYLAVNLKVGGTPPKRLDYRKKQIERAQRGEGLTRERRDEEKKKGIIRWVFKSY